MENQMTEFQKFLFFSKKRDELSVLKEYDRLLRKYGNESTLSIRKALRISAFRWSDYIYGVIPLPDGFVERFENKFGLKIRDCKEVERRNTYDVLDSLRVKAPRNLQVKLTPIGPIEGELEKIVNPQNDPATV